MHKKILIFAVAMLILLSAAQPVQGARAFAGAAWQPLNQTLNDLRLQRTKTTVISGIDVAINTLKASAKGVERSKLTGGQKAGLEAQIESNITWFEGKKQEVKSSKDVAGALQCAKQASERWNEVYPGLKKEIGLMSCDNFVIELDKARGVTAIVSSKIDSMKAQGKDTESLENALAAYNGHIDSASRYVANARSEFNGIGAARQDGHFAAGIKQLWLAEGEMKDAYSDLKAIYRLLLGNSVKIT
jgi:hypothetical protein